MRRKRIAALLCVGAVAAAGCGDDRDDRGASASSRSAGSAAEPTLVEVPDVVGQTADEGSSALEAAGFEPTLEPEPEDPSLCTVSDQDQTDEVEEGSEVILTLECAVEVPDLSDQPADAAASELRDLGLTVRFENEPADSSACIVKDQDVVGEAEAESEVVLSLLCKLPDVTGKDVETAVSELQRIGYTADHPRADDPRACTVTSHRSQAEPGDTIDLVIHCATGR